MERGGLVRDGVAIIREVRSVGGAHFDQPRPALRHHVGQPERTANLDELAARNEDFASRRERGQDQQRGAGIVVDDRGRFRTGEFGEEGFDQFTRSTRPPNRGPRPGSRSLQSGNHRIHDAAGKHRRAPGRCGG